MRLVPGFSHYHFLDNGLRLAPQIRNLSETELRMFSTGLVHVACVLRNSPSCISQRGSVVCRRSSCGVGCVYEWFHFRKPCFEAGKFVKHCFVPVSWTRSRKNGKTEKQTRAEKQKSKDKEKQIKNQNSTENPKPRGKKSMPWSGREQGNNISM